MGKKLTEKYGTGVIFKSVGGAMEGVRLSKTAQKYGITNKTAKTDVEVIDAVTGKTIDLLSVKCGEGQASSGNWQDNYAGIMWAADTAKEMGIKVTKGEQKAADDFMEFISSKEFIGSLTTQGGPSGLYTSTGPFAGKDPQILAKQKAAQKATILAQEFAKKGGTLAALYAWTMMGGYHKFEEGSKAIPNKILAVSHDGSQMKISDLNYKLAEKLAPTLKTAARFKSGAAASTQIQEESDRAKEKAKKARKVKAVPAFPTTTTGRLAPGRTALLLTAALGVAASIQHTDAKTREVRLRVRVPLCLLQPLRDSRSPLLSRMQTTVRQTWEASRRIARNLFQTNQL
jgi:hypothetical protein